MKIFKKVMGLVFKICFSVALLFVLFKQIDAKSVLSIIKHTNKPLLLLAFVLSSSVYILCFFRWKMLLAVSGIKPAISRLISPFAGGVFFNLFLPTTIGGDLVRSADLAIHTKKANEVVATVILDRLSGYIGMVFVALIALLFGGKLIEDRIVFVSIAGLTLFLILIMMVFFNKAVYSVFRKLFYSPDAGKIRAAIEDIHQEIYNLRDHKKTALKNLALSVLVQAIAPVTSYIIALSLGIDLNIAYFFIILPIISAISMLPVSLGGLGIRDAATIFFFAKVGVGKDLAFAMSLIGFLFIVIYAGIGGFIYVFTLRYRRV